MGSGFESQGAHFTENPADSSESAGFCVPLEKQSSWVEESVFVLVPTGDLSSQSSDTLMSLRTTPIPQMVSAGSAGARYPAGGCGSCAVVWVCAPCLANWSGGGCRGLMCCVVVGCFACRGEDVHRPSSVQQN